MLPRPCLSRCALTTRSAVSTMACMAGRSAEHSPAGEIKAIAAAACLGLRIDLQIDGVPLTLGTHVGHAQRLRDEVYTEATAGDLTHLQRKALLEPAGNAVHQRVAITHRERDAIHCDEAFGEDVLHPPWRHLHHRNQSFEPHVSCP